ncbi:signal peptidase II [bacterium]|nr:signal peptidase II [bacterium]
MSKKSFACLAFYFLALAVYFLDQWLKLWVVDHMGLYQSIPLVKDYFALTYVRNIGAAFSAFSGQVWALALVAGSVSVAIIVYMHRLKEITLGHVLSLGLLLGGTLGNFSDRVRLGYVVDMFDAQWQGRNFFPIFNVADIAIDTGVAILLLIFFLESREAKRVAAAQAQGGDSSDAHPAR